MEDGFQEIIRKNPMPWGPESVEQKYINFLKWVHEEYEGANWDELSILQFSGDSFSGGNAELKHGYKSLLDSLQKDLNIRLNSEVKQIEYNGSTASVTVFNHETKQFQVYQCKFVICTVSIGVLKDSLRVNESVAAEKLDKGLLRFHPPLPDWKRTSLDCVKIGIMDKVILQFSKPFWGILSRIVHIGDTPGDYPWFDAISDNPPTLLAWTACRFADDITQLSSDEEIVNHCMKILRIQFPKAPDPVFAHVTRWRKNPFTRGSYSFITTGATTEGVSNLQLPVQNIFFAGEAYAGDHLGCVHGAYLTGKEAAETITTSLNSHKTD